MSPSDTVNSSGNLVGVGMGGYLARPLLQSKDFRSTDLILAVCLVLLTLHAALRGSSADLDAPAYIDWYESISALSAGQFINEVLEGGWYVHVGTLYSYEVGFATLTWVFGAFRAPVEVLFGFITALSLGLKLVVIRRYCISPVLGLIWYVSWYYILLEFNAIRAGIAAGFVLISVVALLEGKNTRFLMLVVLGATFHLLALAALVLPILRWQVLGRLQLLALLLGGIGLGYLDLVDVISALGAFMPKIAEYERLLRVVGAYEDINRFNVIMLARLTLAMLLIWQLPAFAKQHDYYALGIRAYVASLSIYFALVSFPVIGGRVSQFLGVVDVIGVPLVTRRFSPRIVGILGFLGLCAAQFYAVVFYSKLADFFYFVGEPSLAIPSF